MTILWLFFGHLLYDVFDEGLNSVHLSEQHANVIKISEKNIGKINNRSRAYGVCKLKDTMTDHYVLCIVTLCFMGTLA